MLFIMSCSELRLLHMMINKDHDMKETTLHYFLWWLTASFISVIIIGHNLYIGTPTIQVQPLTFHQEVTVMCRPSSVRETSPVMESMENIWLDGILGVCSRRLKRSSPLTEPRSSRSRASTCINGIPETQAGVTKLIINTKRANHVLPMSLGGSSPLMKPFLIFITIQTAPLKVLLPLRSPS